MSPALAGGFFTTHATWEAPARPVYPSAGTRIQPAAKSKAESLGLLSCCIKHPGASSVFTGFEENLPSNIKGWHGCGSIKEASELKMTIFLMAAALYKAS